ncbi:MAG: hypothetical protein VZR73_15625, partial [Acutalibacteraceae bacterium]|nr:hypothetical protein [Acutalibacteraceae bacterium]
EKQADREEYGGLPEEAAFAEGGQAYGGGREDPEQKADRQRERREQNGQCAEGTDGGTEQPAAPVHGGMRQAGAGEQQRVVRPEIGKQQNIQIYRHAITVLIIPYPKPEKARTGAAWEYPLARLLDGSCSQC